MPFLRIVRDKRGYEYFSLLHQTSGRRGKVRQQLLYWFRSPPNIRVGKVTKVTDTVVGDEVTLRVEPSADLTSLTYVKVVLREPT